MGISSIDRSCDPTYSFVQGVYLNVQRYQCIVLIVQTDMDPVVLFVYMGHNLFDFGFCIGLEYIRSAILERSQKWNGYIYKELRTSSWF